VRNPPYFCALDAAMDVIGGKWKALILWALDQRPHRFGELRRGLPGVSEKVLTHGRGSAFPGCPLACSSACSPPAPGA
jgi:DNA-binding HxlR family transcriptional regulator